MQVIEGSCDTVLFENFLFETIRKLRVDEDSKNKQVVVFLDNAKVHKHPWMHELADRLRVTILYSAPYLPWLQPVETLHEDLKRYVQSDKTELSK
jgi:transposase